MKRYFELATSIVALIAAIVALLQTWRNRDDIVRLEDRDQCESSQSIAKIATVEIDNEHPAAFVITGKTRYSNEQRSLCRRVYVFVRYAHSDDSCWKVADTRPIQADGLWDARIDLERAGVPLDHEADVEIMLVNRPLGGGYSEHRCSWEAPSRGLAVDPIRVRRVK